MPITPTYPGVYIEEIPSGVRTITGVATSVTAFIGRALRGPVNEPTTINSYSDFERTFGGLWLDSAMSFAVRDFYLNGGSQAIIVRLHNGATAATVAVGGANLIDFEAANVGAWGNDLTVTIDHDTKDSADTTLFNLTVEDGSGNIEKFLNVSVSADNARYVTNVLEQESNLIKVTGAVPIERPDLTDPNADPVVGSGGTGASGSDGSALEDDQFNGAGLETAKEGIYALENADLFNLLCIPPYLSTGDVDTGVMASAAVYCEGRRAMLLVDPRSSWNSKASAKTDAADFSANIGTDSKNAALFFPRLTKANPLRDNQLEDFAPCGAVAGIMARTDAQRGVWKAPAGLEANLVGVSRLSVPLTDAENGELNPLGVNCLRAFPGSGRVIWGARTLQGSDRLASEWKYIPVRRMALFLEESLYRGTQWVVFEPNDEPLWAQIRLNLGAFMHNLFRQGAFQGKTPAEAYLVKCDKETTTQNDINLGIVNIVVGFAPLKPAEFVIIKIQQLAGQVES